MSVYDIISQSRRAGNAGVAQLAEQLICNQQVAGSSPITSSIKFNMGEFPSGQRGQTVNLLRFASVVRIHLPPPHRNELRSFRFFYEIKKISHRFTVPPFSQKVTLGLLVRLSPLTTARCLYQLFASRGCSTPPSKNRKTSFL